MPKSYQYAPLEYRSRRELKKLLKEHGPGLTYEQACAFLNEGGWSVPRNSFGRIHSNMFPEALDAKQSDPVPAESANGREVKECVAPLSKNKLEASFDFDRLSAFIRFTGAVDAVGGIAKAKAYIALMEEFGRKL